MPVNRRSVSFLLSPLFLLAILSHPTRADEPADAGLKTWLETNIPLYMQESRMPGFSIAVVKDGKTIYAEGFGSRDPRQNLPATPETLYGVGSLTKSFVAIGIVQLVEAGKIRLDDPVSRHIPFDLGIDGKPITIHHLLTHTSGIPSLASSNVAIYRGLGLDTGVPLGSARDFYRFVNGAQDEIVAEPGSRFFYHNAAWRMLGHIIQEKSGMPFHRYLKEKIFNPLGMQRTTLNVKDFASDPNHIVPHKKTADGGNEPASFPYPNPNDNPEFSFLAGAGGVVSSVNEMTRYLNVQIETGAHSSGRLASADSFKMMQKLQVRRPDGHYGARGYGYGLGITPKFLGQKKISHGGSILVSTAHMAFIPELKVGVIMMGNSSGMPYSTIAESVFAVLMGKDPEAVIPAVKIKARMEGLTGNYEVYRGLDKLTVLAQGGMLYLKSLDPFSGQSTLTPLIPHDPELESTTFYTLQNGLKSPVEFQEHEDGTPRLFLGRYCYHKRD